MNYKPYLAGIGFAAIFGFSFMFTRGALENIAPFHLVGLRFALATATLGLLRLAGLARFRLGPADLRALLPVAVFQPIIYFSCETVGIQLTSSSQGGMMIALIPICVTILAAPLLKEYPTRPQLLFVFTSVGGVIFIFIMQNRTPGAHFWGNLALIGAVLAASCYSIVSRRAARRYSPLQRTWVMMLAGGLFFNGVAMVQHAAAGRLASYFEPLAAAWPSILYLGVLSSVVAFFLMNYSLSHISAVQSSVFANLVTVISIGAGVLILGEDFAWYHALGAAAILAGVWGTNRFSPAVITEVTRGRGTR